MKVIEFIGLDGKSPFATWFDRIDGIAAAKVTVAITRLANGNTGSAKALGTGISELKIDFGPGYRVYFGVDGDRLVVLVGGGTKKRQQQDIERAVTCWRIYRQRKKEK